MKQSQNRWLHGLGAARLAVCSTLGLGLLSAAAGNLTLSLQPSLDGGGDIKATNIANAHLLDATGALVKSATGSGTNVQFDLSGVAAGNYFIRINGLADDLVPTRIDDPAQALTQSVGQKLRFTVLGNLADPTYNAKTYSKGQGEHPMVSYPAGTNVAPEGYAYALVSLKTSPQKIEVRQLGTAALLNSLTAGAVHPFGTWILGANNHGKDANYGGDDSRCNACHGNLDTKPALYSQISNNNGWCYRCHYGKAGDPNGFIQPFSAGHFTLSLQSSLDGGGDLKAASISTADLLSAAGAVLKSATGSGTNVQFDLVGVASGDYFIRVNGLGDDLVPTRIDDPTKDITQSVGQKLRMTVIGNLADPAYNLKTYSKGQGEHPVVNYSDGVNLAPEAYAYALVSLKSTPQRLEVRLLGSAALLNTYSTISSPHPFVTWSLGGNNHGKDANYGGVDSRCNTCHGNLDTKASLYTAIQANSGWCYKCHYGKGGDPNGFVANPPALDLQMYAGLMIDGTVGSKYRIDFAPALGNTNNWTALTTITLPTRPYLWVDVQSPGQPKRFYRAVLAP